MATRALSADARRASSEIPCDISTPSRRSVFAIVAGAGALAATPTLAGASVLAWNASDWMTRWAALGCGLKLSGNALRLNGRLNGDRDAIGAMLIEIAPAARQTAVIKHMQRLNDIISAPANAALEKMEEQFATWKRAMYVLNNEGGDEDHDAPYWNQLNTSEQDVIRSMAMTDRASVIRLWIALEAQVHSLESMNAICREDLATLVAGAEDEDWSAQVIIQALRGLTAGAKAAA